MKRPLMTAAIAALLFGSMAAAARAEITAEDVRTSIKRGRQYLEGQQRNDGSWPDLLGQPGGVSALCTLALLNAGVEPDDAQMQKALDYLRKIKPERTYVVSLQTMVFARAEPERDRVLIRRNVKWLEEHADRRGADYKGAWTYPGMAATATTRTPSSPCWPCTRPSASASSASDRTWRLAKTYWEKCQNKPTARGATTSTSPRGTGSMTCAGITSLVIAADRVQSSDARVVGDRIECCLAARRRRRRPHRTGHRSGWGSTTPSARNPGTDGSSGCSTISTAWSAPAG